MPLRHRVPGVAFELRSCPYAGARAAAQPDKPMNVSAMKRVSNNIPRCFGLLLWLRSNHAIAANAGFVDLWRFGVTAASIPKYLLFRKQSPLHSGQLPPVVADTYKMVAGVNGMLLDLACKACLLPEKRFRSAINLAWLEVESDRYLIGREQVCAAPHALISQALKIFVDGTSQLNIVLPEKPIASLSILHKFGLACADHVVTVWLIRAMHELIQVARVGQPSKESFSVNENELPRLGVARQAIATLHPDDRWMVLSELATQLLSATGHASLGVQDLIEIVRLNHATSNKRARFKARGMEVLRQIEQELREPLGHPRDIPQMSPDLWTTLLGNTASETA